MKKKIILAAKVVVERALGHPGSFGDFLHLGPVETPFGKELRRRVQDPFPLFIGQMFERRFRHSLS
jgi:hypothetical protein